MTAPDFNPGMAMLGAEIKRLEGNRQQFQNQSDQAQKAMAELDAKLAPLRAAFDLLATYNERQKRDRVKTDTSQLGEGFDDPKAMTVLADDPLANTPPNWPLDAITANPEPGVEGWGVVVARRFPKVGHVAVAPDGNRYQIIDVMPNAHGSGRHGVVFVLDKRLTRTRHAWQVALKAGAEYFDAILLVRDDEPDPVPGELALDEEGAHYTIVDVTLVGRSDKPGNNNREYTARLKLAEGSVSGEDLRKFRAFRSGMEGPATWEVDELLKDNMGVVDGSAELPNLPMVNDLWEDGDQVYRFTKVSLNHYGENRHLVEYVPHGKVPRPEPAGGQTGTGEGRVPRNPEPERDADGTVTQVWHLHDAVVAAAGGWKSQVHTSANLPAPKPGDAAVDQQGVRYAMTLARRVAVADNVATYEVGLKEVAP